VLQAFLSFILRVAAFLATLWIVQRLLSPLMSRRRAMRNPTGGAPHPASGKMVKDPVCGMYMDRRLAIRLEHRGEELFFCSEECKRRFANGAK